MTGYCELTASIERHGRHINFILPGPAAEAIEDLARSTGGATESLSVPVIRLRSGTGQPLCYREARAALQGDVAGPDFPWWM